MTTKLALVVDDSRMARHMLSKMLKEQGIDVDSVESGEEALGYLCDKRPSMIFMDHTMPGMDGFQTLRAIKNDPHTAAIPIIMYTSKEGEVYESQARALGAVGVIPKTLKPLQLAKVLERQNLLPGQAFAEETIAPVFVSARAANDVVIVENPVLPDSTKESQASRPTASSKPSANELHELEERLHSLTAQLEYLQNQPLERRRGMNRGYRLQFLGLALCVVLIGLLLLNNNQISQQIGAIRAENASLKQSLQQQASAAENTKSQLQTELSSASNESEQTNRRFYESIEWALNQQGQFPFGVKPFNDKLTGTLSKLAENLQSAGFKGEINVRSHLGRFCVITTSTGEQVLPEPGQPMSSCDIQQFDNTSGETLGTEQTNGFSNFMSAFDAQYGNTIRLALSTATDRRPVARYPLADPSMDASIWNKIAARNQRIEISINPD